ncbi:universal stress protein [Streptomyces sp. PLAI1-29]|uniref:Universal stress protein n=2 Tax=Streptomyces zingiberis TaxID=2053010 RepID=A0ABX1C9A1_9ACTN|nr:universal stress protein [Streptomyces zingiberis]
MNAPVTPVTVGLDGSPESLAAAAWGAAEATRRALPLLLLRVQPRTPPPLSDSPYHRHQEERLLRESREGLEGNHPGLTVTTRHLTHQDPVQGLVAAAEEAELLVLGSRGLTGMTGFLLGSVGLATAARSARPVVMVRNAPEAPPSGEVVLGWDVRHPSEALLEFAFGAAGRRGVPLRVVSAWAPVPALRYEPSTAAGMNLEPTDDELVRERLERLGDLLGPWRAAHPGVEVVPAVPLGSAGRELVRAAAGASLVAVGRRRAALPLGPRLGSVAHAVLHHASAPVAVVPHD